ncbi:MAG: Crp/Fnr family transcriptional regulator [Chloroflexi bacterium]|nr:Crp/Fnr family transcriptional regulator [Chloroflexota bacterium]
MRFRAKLSRGSPGRPAAAGGRPALTAKLGYLSDTDIFRDLSTQELEEIDRQTAMTTCRRGKVFYTPGETGEVLFILKRGRVNLYRINPDGKKLVIATIGPSTVFGEMSLTGQGMHDTFAEAADDCTLCVMSRSDVEHLLLSKPRVALRFMELIAGRLREVEARMENVAFKSVPARLADALLQLAEKADGKIEGVSHQDLADMVGTYRETATRVLNEFQHDGHIKLGRLQVAILQPDELQAIADG